MVTLVISKKSNGWTVSWELHFRRDRLRVGNTIYLYEARSICYTQNHEWKRLSIQVFTEFNFSYCIRVAWTLKRIRRVYVSSTVNTIIVIEIENFSNKKILLRVPKSFGGPYSTYFFTNRQNIISRRSSVMCEKCTV